MKSTKLIQVFILIGLLAINLLIANADAKGKKFRNKINHQLHYNNKKFIAVIRKICKKVKTEQTEQTETIIPPGLPPACNSDTGVGCGIFAPSEDNSN